jgi:hypothetical protein
MNIPRPRITLDGIQVKSLEKAQRLAAALAVIEEECGIHEVWITVQGAFICPWIDLTQLDKTHMERLLRDLLIRLDRKKYGKHSKYLTVANGQARPE